MTAILHRDSAATVARLEELLGVSLERRLALRVLDADLLALQLRPVEALQGKSGLILGQLDEREAVEHLDALDLVLGDRRRPR